MNEIVWAAQLAGTLEVCAWKPGNVSKLRDFADCRFEDFIIGAMAIGPAFRDVSHAGVGKTVLQAIRDTRKLVGTNTNLGVVLLLTPLAKAAVTGHPEGLRAATVEVIEALSVEDARLVYEAIRLAGAGGLGRVDGYDVSCPRVDITLLEAMELARDRDTVAREYATGFELTFEIGYRTLQTLWQQGCRLSESILQTFLTLLAQIPDSLIARKNGVSVAEQVSRQANRVLRQGGVFSESGRKELEQFDQALRDRQHRLNPGTTADLVAAALFVLLTQGRALVHVVELMRRW